MHLYCASAEVEDFVSCRVHDDIELIGRKNSSSYKQAVAHLIALRDLAKHQSQETLFQTRLHAIHRDYARYSALLRHLHQAQLYRLQADKNE